jgi:hypothetical protein
LLGRESTLRGIAALVAGAFALHGLRYSLWWGRQSDEVLAHEGHAYLANAAPLLTALLALAAGAFVARLARGGQYPRRRRSFGALWLAAAVILLAIYSVQESAEGLIAAGHPGGLGGVLGEGGWLAVPLAVVIGGLVALALRGSDAALGVAARSAHVILVRLTEGKRPITALEPGFPPLGVVSRHLAGRAPPGTAS